ncbi:MAG: DUF58 domain-containing protein [Clostridiales bacterium]|nr:DUF58 domain-containing protein [Clostridiales bacterium]
MLRNKFKYIVILLLAGWLAVLYDDYHTWILFLVTAAVPLVMLETLIYTSRMLSFELVSSTHVVNRGDDVPVSVQITNSAFLPIPNIRITLACYNSFSGGTYSCREEICACVDKRSTTTLTMNLSSMHMGNIYVAITKVRVYDYLRLFSFRKRKETGIKVAVLPAFHETTEDYLKYSPKIQVESDIFSPFKAGDDPSEVFEIREYREGDRFSRIHWKLSIKQNHLMIKDFSEPMNCSVAILADLRIPKGENELDMADSILECALSLSYSFMLKGHIHYLAWYDKNIGMCRRVRVAKEEDLFEAIDCILGSGLYMDGTDMAAVYFAEYPNEQYTDLFFVSGSFSDKQIDSLLMIKAINKINLQPDIPVDDKLVKKAKKSGMGLFSVSSSDVRLDWDEIRLGRG